MYVLTVDTCARFGMEFRPGGAVVAVVYLLRVAALVYHMYACMRSGLSGFCCYIPCRFSCCRFSWLFVAHPPPPPVKEAREQAAQKGISLT